MAIAILQGVGGGGGKTPQQKSIKIIKNGDYSVHSDEGYELERVDVKVETPEPKEEEEKSISITENGSYRVEPTAGKVMSGVDISVNTPTPKEEQEKVYDITLDGNYVITPDTGKALSKVTVRVDTPDQKPEQEKTLNVPYDGVYTVTPDTGKVLKKVTVNVDTPDKIPEQEKSLQVTEDGDYTVTPDSGYVLKKVSVSVNTPDQKVEQEKSLSVTADGTYTVTPDSGKVLSKVTFNVDTPDKIPEQTKTLDVTKDGTYTVKPDSGKVLSEVTVNVDTPDQKPEMVKTLDITSNGTHTLTPDAGYVFKGVTVNVAVPSENLDEVIGEQKTLIAQIKEALAGKAAGGGGEYDPSAEYQRVEYITTAEEDTYPYIITDFYADNESGMEIVASFPVLQDRVPMGSREDSGTTRFYCVYPLSANSIYYGFNTGSSISCPLKVDTIYRCQTNFLNCRLVNVYDEDGIRKGGVSLSATLTPHTAPVSIFGYNNASTGAVSSKREYKLYSARCSKKNEVVREYIPCYRKSDGVVGLYEKFSHQFLTPETGAFTKGADIEW